MSIRSVRLISLCLVLTLLAPLGGPATVTAAPQSIDYSDFRMIGQLGGPTYAVFSDYPYLYFSVGPRLVIWNISAPEQPTFLGQSAVLPDVIQDIYVQGNLAYLACDKAGLVVLDLSSPSWPQLIGQWDIDGYPDNAFGVYADGDLVYLTDQKRGLRILNVADPTAPVEIGSYDTDGFAIKTVVRNDYAYIANEAYRLTILDVSNPASPSEVVYDSYYADGWVWGVALHGDRLLVAQGGLDVLSLADPAAPTLVGSYTSQEAALDVAVSGSTAYITAAGLEAISLSDPAHPVQVGAFPTGQHSTSCPSSGAGWTMKPCRAVALAGSVAYVADDTFGMKAVSIADPASMQSIGGYHGLGRVLDVAVQDGMLYTTERDVGLRILDAGSPSQPLLLGTFPLTGTLGTVEVAGNFAYLGNGYPGYGGVYAIDVSNPYNPRQTAYVDNVGDPNHISIRGAYLYLTTGYEWTGLQILSLSNPAQPQKMGQVISPDIIAGGYDIALRGEYAYVADYGTMRVYNVADPSAPYAAGVYDPGTWHNYIWSVATDPNDPNGLVYITNAEVLSGLDVSDPYSITTVTGASSYVSWGRDIQLFQGLVVTAADQYGINVYDPSAGGSLDNLQYPQPGLPIQLDAENGVIYAALVDGGLGIYAFQDVASSAIGANGGGLATPDGTVSLDFPANAFSESVVISATLQAPGQLPGFPAELFYGGVSFSLEGADQTGDPVQPASSYTMLVHYDPAVLGPVVESSLALYYWDGSAWQPAGGSLDTLNHTVTATPDHFSYWTLLGESRRLYLPLLVH